MLLLAPRASNLSPCRLLWGCSALLLVLLLALLGHHPSTTTCDAVATGGSGSGGGKSALDGAKALGVKLTRKFKRRGARAKQVALQQLHCDAYLTMEDNGEEEETELCERCCREQNKDLQMASVMPNYCYCRSKAAFAAAVAEAAEEATAKQ